MDGIVVAYLELLSVVGMLIQRYVRSEKWLTDDLNSDTDMFWSAFEEA